MSRSKAREVAMMMLYSGLVGGTDTPSAVCEKLGEPGALDALDTEYAQAVAAGVSERASELDEQIAAYAKGWSLDRIGRVDLSILRLAVYEMRYRDDVPVGAAINEAVELAKRYGGDKSSSFINGILGTLARGGETPLQQENESFDPTELTRPDASVETEAT